MSLAQERQARIETTIDQIRKLVDGTDPSLAVLEEVKTELLMLAKSEHLFSLDDFPPPDPENKLNSCLYRLSEDDDHQFALYANVANGSVNAPPHDHTTWAVIVGVLGKEKNKFYKKSAQGADVEAEKMVEAGTGITLLSDDIHSIHIEEGDPVLNFHMYGRALEQLPGRNYWSASQNEWRTFPAHTDIREARIWR